MRPLKSLTFESVVGKLSASFLKIRDSRVLERVKYSSHDTLMSGFAMMFFQHPSLLQFQERMKQKRGDVIWRPSSRCKPCRLTRRCARFWTPPTLSH